MHRIEGENVDLATGVRLFRTEPPFTVASPEWCTAIQEEIMKVIEQAGLEVLFEDNDTRDQLYNAINLQIDVKLNTFKAIATKTITASTYTVTDADMLNCDEILFDTTSNAITVTLPDLASNYSREIRLRFSTKGSSNIVTINRAGSDVISSHSRTSRELHEEGHEIKIYGNQEATRWDETKNFRPTYYVRDEKGSTTNGGTFTLGAWRTRDLNTEKINTITGGSLSSNQITLSQPGKYRVSGRAPAYVISVHRTKLYNITDASDELLGSTAYMSAASGTQNDSFLTGEFAITASKTFEFQHRSTITQSTNGFGVSSDMGVINIYSEITIEEIE